MIVTINTDASFHPKHKVGAYAYWIVSNQGRILQCGAFKDVVRNSHEAETKCIINSLHSLQKSGWDGITKIIINTDSLNAVAILTNDKEGIKRWGLKWGGVLRHSFNNIRSRIKNYPDIEFRHVKAHKSTDNARTWVNDWCDQKAKEMLWREIKSKNIK